MNVRKTWPPESVMSFGIFPLSQGDFSKTPFGANSVSRNKNVAEQKERNQMGKKNIRPGKS